MVATPFLPDRPTQPARRPQGFISCIGTAAVRFPGPGVLAGGLTACAARRAMASWHAFVSQAPSPLTRATGSSAGI
jgi:hypothetical protein